MIRFDLVKVRFSRFDSSVLSNPKIMRILFKAQKSQCCITWLTNFTVNINLFFTKWKNLLSFENVYHDRYYNVSTIEPHIIMNLFHDWNFLFVWPDSLSRHLINNDANEIKIDINLCNIWHPVTLYIDYLDINFYLIDIFTWRLNFVIYPQLDICDYLLKF